MHVEGCGEAVGPRENLDVLIVIDVHEVKNAQLNKLARGQIAQAAFLRQNVISVHLRKQLEQFLLPYYQI